jgi:hypothetical protein
MLVDEPSLKEMGKGMPHHILITTVSPLPVAGICIY